MPVFTTLLQPLGSWLSRRHEFQADAFAARQTRPAELVSALVKLYEDNAATLTPDPLAFCVLRLAPAGQPAHRPPG